MSYQNPVGVIWEIANLLRGDFKRFEYGKVVLPFTVLRRLDWVLAATREDVRREFEANKDKGEKMLDALLRRAAGSNMGFYNISAFSFANLDNDPKQLAANIQAYANGFSPNIREIFEYFGFADVIARLDKSHSDDLLLQIVQKFKNVDLHPDRVPNYQMGMVFEELIRRFSEISNETAGEHFTPREVIKLMVNLLFSGDSELLTGDGIVRSLYDPACGTGGMLSVAEAHLCDPDKGLNPGARLELFGQELNPESYAVCKSDMIIKGHKAENIKFGNSFSFDQLPFDTFNYMLCNPPFGVEWRKVEKSIKAEYEKLGFEGRFGAGLPRIDDGSLLFLLHMISKLKRDVEGTRLAIVFNASPLFSGGPTSGESKIRRWVIENDWLETIISLPDQLFYNTEIYSYIWIVTNRKKPERRGKIQLIHASGVDENGKGEFYFDMPKNKGKKRHEMGSGETGDNGRLQPDHIGSIVRLYGDFRDNEHSKIFDNEDFGYRRIVIERPLRLTFSFTQSRVANISKLPLPVETTHFVKHAIERETDKEVYEQTIYLNQESAIQRLKLLCDAQNQLRQAAGLKPLRLSPKQESAILRALGEINPEAPEFKDEKGERVPDPALRDWENVPFKRDIHEYLREQVTPHVPDAWINLSVRDDKDNGIGKVGYEIPFQRHFYRYQPPRPLSEIEADLGELETRVRGLLGEVVG